ncbi:hypothetical protein [uncultured Mucilaginibacter sp.]|uniref:hypothetical protein n=1 Tax=uncultured Mucilaginibacter sp. TaxID=797541 RepID=UPI0025E6C023|nr:hypothetical protein [uncultured Mucilaginibacter sp.]
MRRSLILLAGLLLFVIAAKAQDQENLKQTPVKRGLKNVVFDNALKEIVASSRHYFKSLQNDSGMRSIIDTVYTTSFKFKEKNTATLTCAKQYVTLGIQFNLSGVGFNNFLKNLNASLPANYVYTEEYDALSKQDYYSFFPKDGTKTVPAGYPGKITVSTDTTDVVMLGFMLDRK